MKSLRRFLTRLLNSAIRRTDDQRLREEIEEHIALQTAENLRAGLSLVEARREAMLKFGGVEVTKQDYRAERGLVLVENLLRDLRFAMRVLRKSPGFTFVAVATLALSIGANAVVFSVLNALILHPLHLPNAESLYAIQQAYEASCYQSYADYLDLRDRNRSFEDLAAYNADQAGLDTGETTTRVWVVEMSGNYFDVLGVQPYVGRTIHPSDEQGPDSAPYVVLTYAYWHNHFQDDRSVVGRVVQLNKHPFTIVGVTPPEFHGTLAFFNPDVFVPIVNAPQISGEIDLNTRAKRWVFQTLGHVKDGVTVAQATADLNAIGSYLEKSYPKDDDQRTFTVARPGLYGDYLGRPVRAFMAALMLLAGLILLAACANLGSLFAARAADRSREVALRLALGASRLRILRQLFTEAMFLSLLGGAVGVWGSVVLLHGLSRWQPFSRWPIQMPVNPDANVYAVALLLTLASGFLFGAVPVRQVLRTDPYEIVKSGSLGRVGRRLTLRDLVLAAQIGICAVLVTSSMVALRGLLRTLHSNFGFDPRNIVLADTDLSMSGYSGDAVREMQRRTLDALETIRGVDSAGSIDSMPLVSGGFRGSLVFTDETADLRSSNAVADSFLFSVSPGYFRAAGTAVLSGRVFTWHDDKNQPRVALINQELARKIFGSATNALGRYFKTRDGARIQVVGIVEDGKYNRLTEDQQPAMFLPILQSPSSQTYFLVRSGRDPGQLVAGIRSAVRSLDAGLPLYIEPLNKQLDTALFASRMAALALGVMGMMGAMLSITGIFGMAAYSVSKRLRELGIRMALGAQRKEVLQAALGRAFKLLAFGSAAGLILGLLASRVLASVVFQATPRDPVVLTGVVLAMALLGLLATWIPAQRALSLDPVTLLREE
ncbi:MAG TPA: ABC transporter permease [Candidatus Methylomirabilis sp.]|nr:ABC transporter permease [Candidatus Methylomirabilis sp.]